MFMLSVCSGFSLFYLHHETSLYRPCLAFPRLFDIDNENDLQAGCGECGGSGCSSRGGGLSGDDCCTSDIEEAGNLCSATGGAPCIIDGTQLS